jgi:tetratricopeptide (TPR) repeat protein
MIVKNEEDHLPRCLGSVQGLADEIVIVDTGSSDRTVEIAGQFGAKLGHFKWCDDFAAARNESLRLCTGDWVLILDADEAVDPLDHAALRALMREEGPQAYRLRLRSYLPDAAQTTLDSAPIPNVSHYAEGREFGYYTDFYALRLCRRFPDLHFVGRIHELLDPFLEARGLEIGRAEVVIHHYGKVLLEREAYKKDFYLRLTEEEVLRDPTNHQVHFNLMMQAMVAGEWRTCLKAAETYTKLKRDAPYLVFLAMGTAHQHLGNPVAALQWLDQLLQAAPDHTLALTYKAHNLAALGRLDEARACLEKAIASQPGFSVSYVNLAELEGQVGRYPEARSALIRGITANPGEEALFNAIIQLDLGHMGAAQAAADAWEAIQALPQGGKGEWHRLVAVSLLKEGKAGPALAVIRMGLEAFPGNEGLERLKGMCG